jgi:hypothetical protein
MYENYLLNPQAIASIMSGEEGLSDRSITPENVEEWIQRNGGDKKYFGRRRVSKPSLTNNAWLTDVRGAKILEDMFEEMSEGTVEYDKVNHGIALTEWIVKNAPNDLTEIVELVERALPPRTTM